MIANDKIEMYYEHLRDEANEVSKDEEFLYLTDAIVPEDKILTMVDVYYDLYLNEERFIKR